MTTARPLLRHAPRRPGLLPARSRRGTRGLAGLRPTGIVPCACPSVTPGDREPVRERDRAFLSSRDRTHRSAPRAMSCRSSRGCPRCPSMSSTSPHESREGLLSPTRVRGGYLDHGDLRSTLYARLRETRTTGRRPNGIGKVDHQISPRRISALPSRVWPCPRNAARQGASPRDASPEVCSMNPSPPSPLRRWPSSLEPPLRSPAASGRRPRTSPLRPSWPDPRATTRARLKQRRYETYPGRDDVSRRRGGSPRAR